MVKNMKTQAKAQVGKEETITDVVWDIWPKLDEEIMKFIFASEEDHNRASQERKAFEDKVIEAEGPVNGYITILEDELDLLTERLNSLVDYAQSAEEWKERTKAEYVVSRKKLAQRLTDLV
jgi:hypothetical protein